MVHPSLLILFLSYWYIIVNHPLNPDECRLERKIPTVTTSRRQHQLKKRFIQGPIPLTWIQRMSAMSAKTVVLALLLWYRRGFGGEIKLTNALLQEFGVSRASKYRGLRQLEQAGLVHVSRKEGKNPIVEILRG